MDGKELGGSVIAEEGDERGEQFNALFQFGVGFLVGDASGGVRGEALDSAGMFDFEFVDEGLDVGDGDGGHF